MSTVSRAVSARYPSPLPSAPEPPGDAVRGGALLERLDGLWQRVARALSRGLPVEWDPLAQAGAVANTTFMVAAATGIILLFWYVPSVTEAHASVAALAGSRGPGGLVRTLHRYSSDACMAFVALHAIQVVIARRFTGGRWLSWVTGVVMLVALWFVGWIGYWLVWDEPARQVALGTARVLDVLPIFTDPLARSFLVDEHVNSLLFFLVFFIHMLVPLAMAFGLWLHVARLARSRFFTGRLLTGWVVGSLVLLSLALPAGVGPAARMARVPGEMVLDAWYLAPLALTDRLGGGSLWALLLVAGVAFTAVPWWLVRRSAPVAQVDLAKCNACEKCFHDCPYEAIVMVPRSDGSRWPAEASVLPDRCVGCGICAGSCDSSGVGLPDFGAQDQRRRIEAWIDEHQGGGETVHVALLCAHSAGGRLAVDPVTGLCGDLPGYRVLSVPCAGWIHPLTVERALRRGARGVLVVSSAPGACAYREGSQWLAARLDGRRAPMLRTDRVSRDDVLVVELGPAEGGELRRRAAAFRGDGRPVLHEVGRPRRLLSVACLVLALGALVALGSALPYTPPQPDGPELVVSFKHPGQVAENCRDLSPEEIEALPAHMKRTQDCERSRAAVRLRVLVDGREALLRSYEPGGLWNDGASVAVARVPVTEGGHAVTVEVGDTHVADEWNWRRQLDIDFDGTDSRVVLFDRDAGFTLH